MKDAFLVALEEHHDPVSGSSGIPLGGGKCKSKQVERNNDGDGDDDDSEDDADDEDDSRQKLYPRAPCRKRRPRSKIDNVCHVCSRTFQIPSTY